MGLGYGALEPEAAVAAAVAAGVEGEAAGARGDDDMGTPS